MKCNDLKYNYTYIKINIPNFPKEKYIPDSPNPSKQEDSCSGCPGAVCGLFLGAEAVALAEHHQSEAACCRRQCKEQC